MGTVLATLLRGLFRECNSVAVEIILKNSLEHLANVRFLLLLFLGPKGSLWSLCLGKLTLSAPGSQSRVQMLYGNALYVASCQTTGVGATPSSKTIGLKWLQRGDVYASSA